MYVNNNLYFVGNLRYLNIHFQEVVLIYVWLVEKSVSLANSPYFPLSSIIPFVRLKMYVVLHCIVLCNNMLYCAVMYHTVMYCTVLYDNVPLCLILFP